MGMGYMPIFYFDMATDSSLENIIAPAVAALGLELVTCVLTFEGHRKIIRVYIDGPHGVTVDDCARVSQQVSAILEVQTPITGQFHLEVSSPGLDRPLITPAHYRRFLGQRIHIKLHNALAGRKNFTGELKSISDNDGQIQILVDGQTIELSFENIEKANLIPDLRF
jgi:ribosome maturation factor RimP